MTDWGASGRTDSYTFKLVEPFSLLETGGELEVEYGESDITFGYYTDNHATASIAASGEVPAGKLVRVGHHVECDGDEADEVLGTFFVEDQTADALDGLTTRSLDCYSTYLRFTGDVMVGDFYRAKGANVVDAIRYIVEANGGILEVLEGVDEGRTFGNDILFEIGETRSTVLSTIAGWIGCKMGVDALGNVTIGPTPDFSEIQPAYAFEDGANCTYLSGYRVYDSNDDKVNRVLAYYSDEEGSASVWVDLDAGDPFSYESIGRHVSHVISKTEEATEDELRGEAQDYLDANHGSIWYYEIEHCQIPGVSAGSVVTYSNGVDGEEAVNAKCLVAEMGMTLGMGCMCKTKLKVIG